MKIRRIVPNIASAEPGRSRDFYSGFLGLDLAMDMGWIATYVSSSNPTAQVSILRADAKDVAHSVVTLSVEVDDVDRAHREAVARGYPVVYPLTDEPFGVRRFWVEDPNGIVINIMCHITKRESS